MFYYKDRPITGQRGPSGPDGNPLGTIISFMGLTAPAGYLACDGGVYNIAEYTELAFFFKAQFGAENYFGGDGTTTFAVPDLRNLFLRGYRGEAEEQLSGDIGEKQAATELISCNVDVNNNLTYSDNGINRDILNPDSTVPAQNGYRYVKLNYTSNNIDSSLPAYRTARPINMAVLYCVKALPSEPVLDEYDTEDGWHVRKWSNGYLEMSYKKEVNVTFSNSFAGIGFYVNTGINEPYPVIPAVVYSESIGLTELSDGALVSLYQSKIMKNTLSYIYLFSAANGNRTGTVCASITGRWK